MYIRAHDAGGSTFVVWQWHDDPAGKTIADHAYVIDADAWSSPGARLAGALLGGGDDAVLASLAAGPFAALASERELSAVLATTVLPAEFWVQLESARAAGRPVLIRLTPSQRLAPVPWELLISPVSGERLLRIATIAYEVPYTVHWSRARLPQATDGEGATPLYTVDVANAAGGELGSVLTPPGRARLARKWGIHPVLRPRWDRGDLSTALRAGPSRWIYVGHVSSEGEVGLASIHLSDVAEADDGATGDAALPWFGFARPQGNHRPLTARDLHLGTRSPLAIAAEASGTQRLPAPANTDGAGIWPMPRRVAFVACASGADHGASEVFGLATAALAGGAEWVTATRWILPTDFAFHSLGGVTRDVLPLVDVVLAVDAAQSTLDPVGSLRDWQLSRLDDWEREGALENSPLMWGSLMTYWMPARPDLRNPDTT